MLLLDEFDRYSVDQGEATGVVEQDHLFTVSGNELHPAVMVEILAQTAAAHEGYSRNVDGAAVGGGFLAGIREFDFSATPCIGDTVRTVATRGLKIGELQIVHGEVRRGSEVLGMGELVFYLSDDLIPEAMMERSEESGQTVVSPAAETIKNALESALVEWNVEERRAVYTFSPSFSAFGGHFPSYPILPAVVLVMIAELITTQAAGNGWALGRISKGKFRRPVFPGSSVEVRCRPDAGGARGRWRVRFEIGGEEVARMTLHGSGAS